MKNEETGRTYNDAHQFNENYCILSGIAYVNQSEKISLIHNFKYIKNLYYMCIFHFSIISLINIIKN